MVKPGVLGVPARVSAFISFTMLLTASRMGDGVSAGSGTQYTTLGGTGAFVWGEGG